MTIIRYIMPMLMLLGTAAKPIDWYTIIPQLATFGFINWIRTPHTIVPTPENLHVFTLYPTQQELPETYTYASDIVAQIAKNKAPEQTHTVMRDKKTKDILGYIPTYKGVHVASEPHITIFSHGMLRFGTRPSKGGGFLEGYDHLRNHFLYNPVVCFDYLENPKSVNFGQETDQSYLNMVYQHVCKQSPEASISLMGICMGCANILQYAATNPDNLETIVLFSPLLSLETIADYVCSIQPWLRTLIGPRLFSDMIASILPNYDKDKDVTLEKARSIKNKTIFIAHRRHDTMVALATIITLVDVLNKHNTVYLYVTDDTTYNHARLQFVRDVQITLNAFYAAHGIPHDATLAQEGAELLASAAYYGNHPEQL